MITASRHLPTNHVRDPVHGYIHLDSDQWHIIDTPLLQRLRRIRQLAFTSLVYPGATHTRFDHTLGVAYVASRIAAATNMNDDDRRLLGLAAILHDVGHGPFSHLSEQALIEIADSCSGRKLPDDAHEKIALHLIQNDSSLSKYLSLHQTHEIYSILTGSSRHQLLSQAISGPIDADKQDYLLRDAHYCGVKYGLYDIERLHNTIGRHPKHAETEEAHIGIRPGGIEATEQFVQARYFMHAQVYTHPVRLCTDYMLVRALLLAVVRDELSPIVTAYTYDDTCSFASAFSSWDDQNLLQYAESEAPPTSKFAILMKRLRDRQLFKRIYYRQVDSMDEVIRGKLMSQIAAPTKRQLEFEIARDLRIDADFVIFSLHSLDWGFKQSGSADEGSLLIIRDGDRPVEFHEESLIFQPLRKSLSRLFVSVYAPLDVLDMPAPSERSRRELDRRVGEIVFSVLRGDSPTRKGVVCH